MIIGGFQNKNRTLAKLETIRNSRKKYAAAHAEVRDGRRFSPARWLYVELYK